MRKFLTTGFLGAILGLLVGAPADASLISRSFLDQALTDYATNTALDLKADKADVTDLSDKIGDAWPYISEMSPGLHNLSLNLYPGTIPLENVSDLVRFLFGGEMVSGIDQGGVLNLLGQSVVVTGAYDIDTGQIDNGFRSLLQLTDGWTDSENNTYLGVKGLNDKIGSYYWQPENGEYKFSNIPYFKELFPSTSPDKNLAAYDMANNILLNYTDPDFPGLAGVTNKLLNGWTNSNGYIINPGLKGIFGGWTVKDRYFQGLGVISDYVSTVEDAYGVRFPLVFTQGSQSTTIDGVDYTGPVYPLWKLSEGIDKIDSIETIIGSIENKIGMLPSGNMDGLRITSKAFLFGSEIGPETTMLLPYSLEELIKMLFVYDETPAAFEQIISGYYPNSETPHIMGLYPLTTGLLKLTKDIGTLPSGTLLDAGGGSANLVYQRAQNGAPVYPTSMEEFVLQIYGEVGKSGGLVSSLLYDINSAKSSAISANSKATTAQTTADTAKAAADANTAKIGDLPTEYATVGAALTAIKGIAEEAKAAALAAIPDPKTEGSTGKFVLTVDIVGDNATYRWEKIDREGETTTTTE